MMINAKKYLLVFGVAILLTACGVGRRAAILSGEDVVAVGNTPANSCLVVGGMNGLTGGMYDKIVLRIDTTGGQMDAITKAKGFTEQVLPFVYLTVPKGDFKLTWARFDLWTGKTSGPLGQTRDMEITSFGSPGVGRERSFQVGGHSEKLPEDFSGKCEGGFIWVGVYDLKHGGIFSSSKLSRSSKSFEGTQRSRFIESLKEQFKGTPWETTIK